MHIVFPIAIYIFQFIKRNTSLRRSLAMPCPQKISLYPIPAKPQDARARIAPETPIVTTSDAPDNMGFSKAMRIRYALSITQLAVVNCWATPRSWRRSSVSYARMISSATAAPPSPTSMTVLP
jgi:hypothetical protein